MNRFSPYIAPSFFLPEDPRDAWMDDYRDFIDSEGIFPCPDCGSRDGDVLSWDCRTCGGCWGEDGEWVGGEE